MLAVQKNSEHLLKTNFSLKLINDTEQRLKKVLLENLRQDYVRTARAKGLRERTVVYVHALRNSLLAMITILTGLLPGMIGGAVIVETIFGLPGMGKLYIDAINMRDYPTVMTISMITATLTLLAMLLADILYAVVDPRIRYA